MKQLLQSIKTGQTYVADVPAPVAQRGMVLVRSAASLVSAGTERMVVEFAQKSLVGKARSRPDLVRQILDKARREGLLTALDAAFNRLDQPMPLGYSSAGTVIAAGPGVQGFQPGDRVACAGGGYAVHAETVAVPQNLVVPLPEGVPFDQAAFTTLGAIALHGFRLAEAQLGERVAVIGLGLLGQLAAGIARAAGCQVLGIDLDPARTALAESLGIPAVLRGQAEESARSFTRGRGFDAVLICADTPSDDPIVLAGEIARDRARVVAVGAVGLNIPRRAYYAKELTFLNSRSYGPGRYDPEYEEKGRDYPFGYVRWTEGRNLEAFAELLGSGRLEIGPLITHRFPIERAPEAYDLITGKAGELFLGVLITYAGAEDRRLIHEERDVNPELQPSTGALQLGVIGAGNFATAVMLPAVRNIAGIRRVGIVSAGGLNARHAADRFGFAYAASDVGRLLEDPEINTVAVLTRHGDHAPLALAALRAGKHVFVEKPLALDPASLAEIEHQALARPGQLLLVGFNRRFAPFGRQLADFFRERREPLHAAYRVNAGFLPRDHWLHDPDEGGGRIIGEGCHFMDFLTFLVGEPPVDVTAHALPDGGVYQEDNVQLTFTFPDGSVGTLSYLANGDKAASKERVEVFCGGRVAVLDDFRTLVLIRDGKRQVRRARLRQDKGHAAIWAAFAASVAAGGPAPIPLDHLVAVTRASFGAVSALRSGGKVELLPAVGDEAE